MSSRLLKILQDKLKWLSVNSVDLIDPEDFMDMIECNGHQAKVFIEFLHEERLLKYKYCVRCECGEEITVNESRILNVNEDIHCSVCGCYLDRQMIQMKGQLAYALNRKEILDFRIDDETSKWEKNGYKTIIPFYAQSVKEEEKMMKKKQIFIGSSTEAAENMSEIAAIMDSIGAESRPWNSVTKPVFVAGNYTLDTLLNVADSVDGAIFIFNAEDRTWYSKRCESADEVRDNVLLEYGVFCGKKGYKKVIFVCKNKPKIATDLLGITYVDGNQSESQIRMQLKTWLEQV